jgi:hypothetical protein
LPDSFLNCQKPIFIHTNPETSMGKGVKATGELPSAAFFSLPPLDRALHRLLACTSLPGCVTIVCRGMPTVWRGRHRLLFCWRICMPAVSPGRKTLAEMPRWTPATITAWRWGRVLTAASWHVCPSACAGGRRLACPRCPPQPTASCLSGAMAATPTHAAPSIRWGRQGVAVSLSPGC